MLLIDGVKYEEWTPTSEDRFEELVKEHAQEIFGEASIYLDIRKKLKSVTGAASIPDGFVISFGETPSWYIVEMELSSHYLYEHIVSQMGRFIRGIGNPSVQRNLVNSIYETVTEDDFDALRLRKAIEPIETYKFISDLVSKQPVLTIIIEKKTPDLEEALNTLNYSQIKVIEFQSFIRKEVGLLTHAHIFEPLRLLEKSKPKEPKPAGKDTPPRVTGEKAGKVTFEELVKAGLIAEGQILLFYNTRPFPEERAQVIASLNKLRYETDNKAYSKSELAKLLLIKHGFRNEESKVAGPKYWRTEQGKPLHDLEEQVRKRRGDRT